MDWLIANKEWVFSGVGLSILSILIALFRELNNKGQNQKVGDNSTAIQVGRDLKVGDNDDER